MSVYLRRSRQIMEDDQSQGGQSASTQGNPNAAELERLNSDIVACQNAIVLAEKRYNDEKKRQNDIILQKSKRIAELGGKVDPGSIKL